MPTAGYPPLYCLAMWKDAHGENGLEDLAALVLRIVAASVFVAHGWPKAFWDRAHEHGRARLEGLFTAKRVPYPAVAARLLGYTEVVAGGLVGVGFLTRLAVIPLIVIIAAAIPMAKWRRGFIDGWDWPMALTGIGVAILLIGGGDFSLDALLDIPL